MAQQFVLYGVMINQMESSFSGLKCLFYNHKLLDRESLKGGF